MAWSAPWVAIWLRNLRGDCSDSPAVAALCSAPLALATLGAPELGSLPVITKKIK